MRNENCKTIKNLLLTGCLLLLAGNLAAAEKPLLMEGKKTLYQRVLSVPTARLYSTPADSSTSTSIVPFSVLYVYQKESDWLKVGYDSFGKSAGWVKDDINEFSAYPPRASTQRLPIHRRRLRLSRLAYCMFTKRRVTGSRLATTVSVNRRAGLKVIKRSPGIRR